MIKKTLSKIIWWTRVKPTLFDTCWYVYSSIRIFLEDSSLEFKEKRQGKLDVLDFWCWNQPYKYIFNNDNYNWCDIWNSPEYNENMTVILEWDILPYTDNKFDLIICTEVMEHIKFPELYCGEFARVLKPGWLLLITVPQLWGYHPYPQHFFNYTPDWLNLFLANKFSSSEFFSDTTPFQTWIMISMMYSNFWLSFINWIYTVLVNSLFLTFPKYRKYNSASSQIFARYIK